ncbi:hypothetical protein [Caulobacter segnis]
MTQVGSVPRPNAPDVLQFLSLHQIQGTPEEITYRDLGYDPAQCHVSCAHRVAQDGGTRVHGWAIWQFDGLVLAEFHSVWRNNQDELIDVTPPKFGAQSVLFVPDPTQQIEFEDGHYYLPTDRASLADHPYWFQGQPTEYTHWPLAENNPVFVNYRDKLGLPTDFRL